MKKNTKMSGGKMVAVGAGVAALGAGAYYLMGPKGKAHQKKAMAVVDKMKKSVASEVKKAKAVSAPIYHKAVDVVAANYAKQYKMHEGEIKAVAKKLKSEWKSTEKTAKKTVKKAVKVLKKKVA